MEKNSKIILWLVLLCMFCVLLPAASFPFWECRNERTIDSAEYLDEADCSEYYINTDTSLKTGEGFSSGIVIETRDEETEKPVTGSSAVYEITDAQGTVIISNLKTGIDGSVRVPEKLCHGQYRLREVQAPSGYMANLEACSFSVKQDTETIRLVKKSAPQKGIITVFKKAKREMEEVPLKNAVFQIIATEDITTADGTTRLKAGQLADTIKTDHNGEANSGELYPGKYNIVEKKAPVGYQKEKNPFPAELRYAAQDMSPASLELNLVSEYFKE